MLTFFLRSNYLLTICYKCAFIYSVQSLTATFWDTCTACTNSNVFTLISSSTTVSWNLQHSKVCLVLIIATSYNSLLKLKYSSRKFTNTVNVYHIHTHWTFPVSYACIYHHYFWLMTIKRLSHSIVLEFAPCI